MKNNEDLTAVVGEEKLRSLRGMEPGKLGSYSRPLASSFANLAAQLSKIPKTRSNGSSSLETEDSDEDFLENLMKLDGRHRRHSIAETECSVGSEMGYSSEPCSRGKKFSLFEDHSTEEEEETFSLDDKTGKTRQCVSTFTGMSFADVKNRNAVASGMAKAGASKLADAKVGSEQFLTTIRRYQ